MTLDRPPDPLLLTRSLRDAPQFSRILRRHNWRVLGCPSIQIVENPIQDNLDFLSNYYDWIIFNSRYAVTILFETLKKQGMLDYFIKAKRICAVGPETARVIRSYGIEVDLVPATFSAKGVVELFKRFGISQQQILLTMGDRSDTWLTRELDALGNQCTPVEVYRNLAPRSLPDFVCDSLQTGNISFLAVTSPSAVYNLLSVPRLQPWLEELKSIPVASIGPTTSSACRTLGFRVEIESRSHTLDGLAESLVNHQSAAENAGPKYSGIA